MARTQTRRNPPVHVRLTTMGWCMLGGSLLIGLAAAKSHAPFLFLLFGALVGAVIFSLAMGHWVLSPIRLHRNLPDRVWQNQTVHMAYYLRNMRRSGGCLAITIRESGQNQLDYDGAYCAHLPAGGNFRSGGTFVPRMRGRVQMPGVRLETDFPFGLVRAVRELTELDTLIVWPARGQLRRSLLHKGAAEASRAAPSESKGGQDEFFGLRDYREGDDPRWIAWRRSVNGRLVVREMARPRPEILWVVLDCEPAHYADSEQFEKALRFCATLLDHAFTKGYEVALAMAEDNGPAVYAPAKGLGQLRTLLDAIALATPVFGALPRVLAGLDRQSLRQAQLIALTGGRAPGDAFHELRSAARHVDVLRVDRLGDTFEDADFAAAEEVG